MSSLEEKDFAASSTTDIHDSKIINNSNPCISKPPPSITVKN